MKAFAILSSLGCIGAGLWLLQTEPADSNSIFGPLLHGMGLYFVAKGFFVGPSLLNQWHTRRATEWLARQQGMPDDTPTVKPTAVLKTLTLLALVAASMTVVVAAQAAGKGDPRVCAQATPDGASHHAYWCAKAAAKRVVQGALVKRTGEKAMSYIQPFCDPISGNVLRWKCAVLVGGPYATVTVRFKRTRAGWRSATSIVCAQPGAKPANGCKQTS